MYPFDIHILISVNRGSHISESFCILPDDDTTLVVNLRGMSSEFQAGDVIGLFLQHGASTPLRFEWAVFAIVNQDSCCYAMEPRTPIIDAGDNAKIGEIVISDSAHCLTQFVIGPPKRVSVLERLAILADEPDETRTG